jgi:hypothetical protein
LNNIDPALMNWLFLINAIVEGFFGVVTLSYPAFMFHDATTNPTALLASRMLGCGMLALGVTSYQGLQSIHALPLPSHYPTLLTILANILHSLASSSTLRLRHSPSFTSSHSSHTPPTLPLLHTLHHAPPYTPPTHLARFSRTLRSHSSLTLFALVN